MECVTNGTFINILDGTENLSHMEIQEQFIILWEMYC